MSGHLNRRVHLTLAGDELEPPPTRAGCAAIPRPCPRLRCPFNTRVTWSHDHRGRPSADGQRRIVAVRPADDPRPSCALDVVEEAGGALAARETATLIGLRPRQVREIRERARTKLREARLLDDE